MRTAVDTKFAYVEDPLYMQLVITTIFVINWNSEYLSCFTVVNWIAFLIEHRYTYVYAA